MKIIEKGKKYIFKKGEYTFYCPKCGCKFSLDEKEMNDGHIISFNCVTCSTAFVRLQNNCPYCGKSIDALIRPYHLELVDIESEV